MRVDRSHSHVPRSQVPTRVGLSDAGKTTPLVVHKHSSIMPIGTQPVGYANTNLSGRHFNGEATVHGQHIRRRGRSEVDSFDHGYARI
ncbi:hypothetical protein ALC53_13464 [Atta colombica]|uniref:Uncharacterized protein n=1 Tax=Atta colombica TaxID=520822 RepID=A0A195AVH8_9HYME|nr:hypothetical protein ALC53_13464 [Atta colombica]